MGYRSNVRICTTDEGFDMINEFVYEKINGSDTRNLLNCLDEKIVGNNGDFVLFGWNGIKWYDMWNDDVIAIMEALDYINDENIPFHYVRVGESDGDVDRTHRDPYNVLPWIGVDTVIKYDDAILSSDSYFALFRCNEWKNYSSMSLVGVFSKDELYKQLNKEIDEGNMEFHRDKLFKELTSKDIDTSLKYGYIQELSINEVL